MAEDGPSKSDADGAAGASEASASGRRTPEVREEAATPADPSPPKLAPEAPTRTPEKKEESRGIKGDGKPTISSPPEESPPTLTQQPPQQPMQQPHQATPQATHQPKPRGRPPGIPNKNPATMNQQMAMMKQHLAHQAAQQAASMMHRNGHGIPQNMPMPQVIQVNTDGQQQFVQIIPGPPGQFMQQMQMIQGRARFPVSQMRPQQRPQQQMPPGGPNQTVPVLIPVPSGQSTNPIMVSNSALIRHPDGTVYMRPDLVQKQQGGMSLNQHYTDANGQPAVRQLQLTPSQSMQLQKAMMMHNGGGGGIPQQLIIQHHQQQQQQQRAANDLQHMQQQQLTRQNLDRMASGAAAAGSSGSRTLDWVGGLPTPSASNGSGAPSLMQPMPQLQHLQPQQTAQTPAGVIEMDEEENEAAPQLAAEAALNLNVESLNAEEAFQQESHGGHGRRKNAGKNAKTFVHEIDGHKIIETTEPSNSTHLDVDDFEPVADDDDDQSDKSYEGREDELPGKPANGANPGFVDQAALWMQNRLEMDIPRDERKYKKEAPLPHKPSTRADGKKVKRGGRKSNELKSLIQMDFGPAENSRRAQDMLPTLIKTVTLKESSKNLRNNTERRSNSAAGGSIAAPTKETRSLRNRDSTEKTKECRACGNSLDEKKTDKHRGYCNELCSRISRSPMNTEGEEDETTSERTEQTPEPMNRKKESSSTPNSGSKRRSTIEVKEEPLEEMTPTKRRGGKGKKESEETMVVPKKEVITPKKDPIEKKKEEKKVKKEVKEELRDEHMEEEKQKSPVMKKRAGQEKKVEEQPPTKTRKMEGVSLPSFLPPPAACESPALVAALTAPSTYSQQLQPPPPILQQQLMQQARLPAAVAEVGPLPVVAAATVPAAVPPPPPPPTAQEMDSVTCKLLSVEQVRAWVERITGKPEIAQQFASEDVDGETLLTLKYNDLRDDLKLSLGMAKKVYSAIEEICKRRPVGSDE